MVSIFFKQRVRIPEIKSNHCGVCRISVASGEKCTVRNGAIWHEKCARQLPIPPEFVLTVDSLLAAMKIVPRECWIASGQSMLLWGRLQLAVNSMKSVCSADAKPTVSKAIRATSRVYIELQNFFLSIPRCNDNTMKMGREIVLDSMAKLYKDTDKHLKYKLFLSRPLSNLLERKRKQMVRCKKRYSPERAGLDLIGALS